ncbi:MAG: prohibitin family protein [Vicinamibacteria bacterium]|jgi:regulator of protease activity HflC (stomatin/prohibitin superfamily)
MIVLALLAFFLGVGLRWFAFVARKDPRMEGLAARVLGLASSVLLVVALLAVIAASVVVIPAGHVGVQVLFGKVQPTALTEGIQLINPLVDVVKMSVQTETYTMSATSSEGAVGGDDSIQALSSDGLLMPLDITIAYRLVGGDAPLVYRNIGADYVDKIIRPASRTAVREAIAGFTAQEAYSTKREALPQKMHDLLTERMGALLRQREDFKGATGFIVDQVMLRKIQLPDKVKNAIEAKLEAAQQSEQMQFVLEKERQEAERKRIEAKGVSDFQTIVSQSINANLLQWKGIEATETLAKSQNAKVVVIGSGRNGLPVILNMDKEP